MVTTENTTVPKVDISELSADTFSEVYQKSGQPVIITGLLNEDAHWNLDDLTQTLGNQTFLFRRYGKKRYEKEGQQWQSIGSGVPVEEMSFQEYAKLINNGQAQSEDIYLAKAPLKGTPLTKTQSLQALGNQLNLKPVTDYRMYMGHGGHTASLHYDILDGTLCQNYGSKQVILFPPEATPYIYPFPIWIHLKHGLKLRACYSQIVDIKNVNLQKFPQFQKAQEFQKTVILKAGEVLYIPVGWWHEITTLEEEKISCSVSRFWQVYPRPKNYLCWQRWRLIFGNLLALPKVSQPLFTALFQGDLAKVKQIIYKI
ncbi:MAG: cupin-like domain-containing protein [Halothece sp.]